MDSTKRIILSGALIDTTRYSPGGVFLYYRNPREDLAALFVIDGRDYQDVDEMKKAIAEATIRTYQLGLVYETEARLVRNPKEPRLKLPSWDEFKKQLSDE